MKWNLTTEKMTHMALALFAAYAALLLPMDALATGSGIASGAAPSALSKVLCNVVDWFNGPVGGGLATIAIIVIGVGALMGKVSWGMAIIVGLGIGVIFGAPQIVTALGATSTCP